MSSNAYFESDISQPSEDFGLLRLQCSPDVAGPGFNETATVTFREASGNTARPTISSWSGNVAPLHLVRVDLATGAASLTKICGLPNGIIANPPLIDIDRNIAIGYDSGNGVLAAFDIASDGSTSPRWRRDQNHACHPLLFADTGELVTTDHDMSRMADQIVVLDIETGAERLRVDSGSAVQSVVFPAVGWNNDLYYCSFHGIARLAAR